jgi:glycosyltransferase involved in cell wall biosynthesis
MQVHGRVMRHLDPQRHQVWLMADPRSGSPEALGDLPHLGIWVHPLVAAPDSPTGKRAGRFRKLINHARVLAGLPRAAGKVRKHGIDILHVGMTFRMMAVGLFLSVASGARLVIHAHQTPRLNSPVQRLLFKAAMARAGAAIGVSEFIKDRLVAAGVKPHKVVAILNTTDLDRFHPEVNGQRIRDEYGIAPDDVLVVCLGRFFPGKGQLDLARAMELAGNQNPRVKALLIGWDEVSRMPGKRSYKEEVGQYCVERALGGTVTIDAARPEAPEIMAAATVVAVPSTDDPCPLTVLEAMASGKPVVGYRSGGIPEEVGDDGGAILVEPGDVKGLARAILDLAGDPEGCRERGQHARRRAERQFYEARLAEEVVQLYQQLTSNAFNPSDGIASTIPKPPASQGSGN